MSKVHLREYGVEATIDFDLFEVDGIDLKIDAAHASGDTKVMKDEGAEANTDNGFTDEGQGYSIVLTATEMQAARIKVYVVDAATKVWLDTTVTIETYGHASAQHAVNLNDPVRAGLTALPNAAADAPGGIPISDAGGLDLDTQLAETHEITAARMGALTDWINGGRLDLLLDAVKAVTDLLPDAGALNDLATILVDTNELQTDWTDGGRLDLLLDLVLEDTGTTLPAALVTIDANVDLILADTGTDGVLLAAAAVDAILDEVVEGTITMRQLLRIMLSALSGITTGGGTATLSTRDVANTKNRIQVTADIDGNRSASTVDGT